MSQRVSKRFSNVRYWRYVFTPLLFLIGIFGIFMLYAPEKTTQATFPALTTLLRNTQKMNNYK